MKALLIIITILIIHANNCFAQNKYPRFIKITYVNWSIETVFSVSCNYFDNAFSKGDYKFYQIKKNSDIMIFGNFLQTFLKIKSNGIDVRGKIEYIFHNHRFKYCFDQFGVFTDGTNYYKNKNLVSTLKQKFKDLFP